MWLWLGKMTSQDRIDLWHTIKTANPIWVLISFLFSILSHLSRAYRWRFMLEPMGYKPNLGNSVAAVMTGYFANTLVLRSGEVLRAVALHKTDDVPFEKGFGTIVSVSYTHLTLPTILRV